MPTQSEFIAALTMTHFLDVGSINGNDDPAITITFQFEDTLPADDFSGVTGWSAWQQAERDVLCAALAQIETFLNVDFVEVTGAADADLSLGRAPLPGTTAGFGGASLRTSGGVVTDYDAFALYDTATDVTRTPNLVLHELGHALGLAHPFEGITVPEADDNNHFSIMSYTADPMSGAFNDVMMLYDLAALQAIWGGADHNTGDTTYTGPRTANVDTIWDTGGTDTLDASAYRDATTLDLHEGTYSSFGAFEDVAIAFGVTIENALGGAGNDRIYGNDTDNLIAGNDGDDLIAGNLGDDVLLGGGGEDVVRGGSGNDVVAGGGAYDVVIGGDGDDTLRGGPGFDKLWGGDGADTFRFRSGADRDVVRDFDVGSDTLEIVGKGALGAVLAAAWEADGDTWFDFGDGDVVTVRNTGLAALLDDLVVI